ncbi:MAG: helix-turn-helix domain-containing protein, partial [Acidimicrobiaceae bacterium]|nr:helix-turn-helix domain-containing protein [Acidimicrobiaceae bacterium]
MTAAERWHPTADLAGLPGMPPERSIRRHAASGRYVSRKVRGNREILESSLPRETQTALRRARGEESPRPAPRSRSDDEPLDLRLEILDAFRRWHRESALPRDRALREWASLYNAAGVSVSEEARTRYPTVSWRTVQTWHRNFDRNGTAGLADKSRHKSRHTGLSKIDAEPELRDFVEAQIRANPHHITAKNIQRALAATFRDRETPCIEAIRRWCRRWRAEHAFELSALAVPDGPR